MTLLVAFDTWSFIMPNGNLYIHRLSTDEIKFGSVLPMDGRYAELFRLRNHASLPDGLYRWSEESRVWVQV